MENKMTLSQSANSQLCALYQHRQYSPMLLRAAFIKELIVNYQTSSQDSLFLLTQKKRKITKC